MAATHPAPAGAAATPRRCADCLHFMSEAAEIESLLPGFRSLSSAYAAIRADDGLCRLHDRYLSPRGHCVGHASRVKEPVRVFHASRVGKDRERMLGARRRP